MIQLHLTRHAACLALALVPFLAVTQDAPKPAAAAAPTMKAARIHAYGDFSKLVLEDAPRPTAKDDQLLVRVYAAGVNPVDDKIREGKFAGGAALANPLVLGFDVSGVVEAVGDKVTRFKVGDPVFAYLDLQRGGGYAEYAIVREREAAAKPAKLTFDEAAAVPLAALTAWQALVDTAKLDKGQSVLIHAGSGGVGSFAIQIAKSRGAKVYATSSAANLEFLGQLGADEAIDYKSQRFEDVAKEVDAVLDPIGGETQQRSFSVLKKGGILVSIVKQPDAKLVAEKGVRGTVLLVHASATELEAIAKLIDAGDLKPCVTKTLPLAEAARAHELIHTGHTRGKIVLHVRDEPARAK